jgi:hypothetical protein
MQISSSDVSSTISMPSALSTAISNGWPCIAVVAGAVVALAAVLAALLRRAMAGWRLERGSSNPHPRELSASFAPPVGDYAIVYAIVDQSEASACIVASFARGNLPSLLVPSERKPLALLPLPPRSSRQQPLPLPRLPQLYPFYTPVYTAPRAHKNPLASLASLPPRHPLGPAGGRDAVLRRVRARGGRDLPHEPDDPHEPLQAL